ncbi:MAG TPA: dimethylmenaquinone methyltransferase [Gammaproteobacteria bacterium]|jgi:RNA polymerase-binding transcription factor DksA|nr:dimethylmenaquinone methyltransferase [Gammaproteobacteria bacterium]
MARDDSTVEQRLLARKAQLTARLHRIENNLDSPKPADFTEQATLRENDEVLEEIGSTGLEELGQIEAALRRIKAGTYGRCEECGEPIAPARLDIVPYTATCIDCSR